MIAALHSSFDSRTHSTLFRLYDSEGVNVSRVEFMYDSHQLTVRFQNYRLEQDFKLL